MGKCILARPSWDVGSQAAGIGGQRIADKWVGQPLRCGVDEDTTAHISRCLSDVFCPRLMAVTLIRNPMVTYTGHSLSSQRDGSNGLWEACLSFHIIKGHVVLMKRTLRALLL